MKHFKITVGILALAAVTFLITSTFYVPKAEADTTFIGTSYSTINTDVADFTGINFIVGHQFNEFLGVEGRALVSSGEESYYGVKVDIDSLYGVYLTAAVPISDEAGIYVAFGHTEGKVTASYYDAHASNSQGSTSLGFGVRYSLLEAYTLYAEYIELFDDVEQFGVGVRLNF